MINSIFFEIRNFIFTWLKKSYGEDYAHREHEFRIGVFWILYYFVLVVMIAFITTNFMPSLNLSSKTLFILKKNFFVKFLGGLLSILFVGAINNLLKSGHL